MKAIVNDKKHLTLVSHTNGVVIVEESGCIIDLDFQSLGSIFELADLGNTYTIKDCDEIETLKADNNELTERIEFLEKQLTNSGDRVTELRNQIIGLTEKLESKTSDLAERTYWFRYYRRAFRAVKEYLKPNEKYDLDSSGYNIVNSIDSKFIISFKDTSIASKAFNELRYSISPRTVLLKYENDIVEYNVDAMNIYFIEANTPTVIRKFNDENFTITCCDVYTAEITNALLNCGFPASDIVSTYKSYIAFSNIN